jgi:RNA polymerase primary sigma factor
MLAMETCELHQIADHKILSREEEAVLFPKAQSGDIEALNTIIRHNLRLVVSIAKKRTTRRVQLEELISVGAEGVRAAALKFDISRGLKFSTYATWWIVRGIRNWEWEQSATIVRVPKNASEHMGKWEDDLKPHQKVMVHKANKAMQPYLDIYDSETYMDIRNDYSAADYIVGRYNHHYIPSLGELKESDLLLDREVWDEDADTRKELNLLEQAMDRLIPEDRDLLKALYGFPPHERPLMLHEYGAIISRSKERVRQIRVRAEERLRAVMEEMATV